MFGCDCFCWNQLSGTEFDSPSSQPFTLPSPIPNWPPGQGFATGRINLGEIDVIQITKFESIWNCDFSRGKSKGVTFYKPAEIPEGYSCLGYYCSQSDNKALRGYVLTASGRSCLNSDEVLDAPALRKPLNYSLVWSSESHPNGGAFFWLPNPPLGYKAMGIVVTTDPNEPELNEVKCVREDLTETCESCDLILSFDSTSSDYSFRVMNTRPCHRGMLCRGVSLGTFFCSTYLSSEDDITEIACLKNLNRSLHAMPNLDQVHAVIKQYGPTVYFHPNEVYMPSSVSWFFKNGAVLYRYGKPRGEPIDYHGSNLPRGGENDGGYWIDLPDDDDDRRNNLKKGDLESAKLYVHVKPALGGTFTDIAMWVFCPFNGPATLKVGLVSIGMTRIGEHVGDWEHFTLRVSNFSGELKEVYFSRHGGGEWVDASDLEFIDGNKFVVYSSKHGHASYPHPGTYLQGSSKFGIGVRNDAGQSKYWVDSSRKYEIIAAEYLGEGVVEEPCWLQYMREWGPTIVYDSRSEIDKIINHLPLFVRFSMETLFELFPTELYGEEGPTGPKEKDNWVGDERC